MLKKLYIFVTNITVNKVYTEWVQMTQIQKTQLTKDPTKDPPGQKTQLTKDPIDNRPKDKRPTRKKDPPRQKTQ